MPKITTLRPDRGLLDASFESYKLSLESIPLYNVELSEKINYNLLSGSVLSKQHIKAYLYYNCLYYDPRSLKHVYYVTNIGSIVCISLPSCPMNFPPGHTVFTLPNWNGLVENDKHFYVTLCFSSLGYVSVFDGNNCLYVFKIEDQNTVSWKLLDVIQPPLYGDEVQLLDFMLHLNDSAAAFKLDFLLSSICEKSNNTSVKSGTTAYSTTLSWLSYSKEDQESKVFLSRVRRFVAPSFPDFVTFEQGAQAIHICSDKTFHLTEDSLNCESNTFIAVHQPMDINSGDVSSSVNNEDDTISLSRFVPVISWTQMDFDDIEDSGSITITFNMISDVELPLKGHTSDLVQISISQCTSHQNLQVKLCVRECDRIAHELRSDFLVLLDQPLFGYVKPDETTWTLDRKNNSIEIHLLKQHILHWPRLLRDKKVDERLIKSSTDCSMTAHVVEQIQKGPIATATEEGDTNENHKPAFNVGQLEDVDFPTDEDENDRILQRIDCNTCECTHQANLSGHQWLCKLQCVQANSQNFHASYALCIRHDVDGIIWLPYNVQIESNHQSDLIWKHVATLQAFGYVLASKRDHRFVACPPLTNGAPVRFVAVADSSKRIYIYHQPLPGSSNKDTELRRRVTSNSSGADTEGIVHVAWQQVVTLPVDEPTIGFLAVEKPFPACIVCTQTNLYLLPLSC